MSGGADHLLVLPIVLPLAAGALLLVVERWWPRGEQALAWAATVGLAAVASLRVLLESLEELQVSNARRQGWSWEQIAVQLHVSRQAVHKKYRRHGF